MRRPVVNNSRPGHLVYDPFLGSGTSLIAAEMTRPGLLRGLEADETFIGGRGDPTRRGCVQGAGRAGG